MATGSDPGIPPTADDHETAADVRMLYEACKADIQSSKAEEWRVTLQVYLFYGAVVAADALLSNDFDWVLVGVVVLAGSAAIWVLYSARSFVIEQRGKLTRLSTELSPTARDYFIPKDVRHDVWFAWFLGAFIAVGLIGAIWIVLCAEPLQK